MKGKSRAGKKPLNIKRNVYRAMFVSLLSIIMTVLIATCWYVLYVSLMPAVNSFMFGYAGGANALGNISDDILPYTVIALWGIPSLMICATLNVLWWKGTIQAVRLARKLYKAALAKFDENCAKIKSESEGAVK